jgi:flagellar M-ring protein FliF
VLKDAGIGFDVSPDGTSVLVAPANTAQARMLLAEKGLPQSGSTGYELFNQLGSFGLTSFMQDITRVRALEGELARTIQTMNGIKAARVHIVLPDRASFRKDQQQASASVVIRTQLADDSGAAQAIRHLVASAVPGMKLDEVTVLDTEGRLLASGDDAGTSGGNRMETLQRQVNNETEEKIRRTLAPYLGLDNFQISVTSQLNTDRQSVSETTYDPSSRVERSVRVVKENGTTQNRSTQSTASVQQNIPVEQMSGGTGNDTNEENQRREELTNYEISSKTVQTEQDGYRVEHLSIAVVVNSERLKAEEKQGGQDVLPIETRLMEIEQLVQSAVGFDKARGDQLKVTAVAFADAANALEPVPVMGFREVLMRQSGTFINAGAILILSVLMIWFGLRPAIKTVIGHSAPAMAGGAPVPAALPEPEASFAAGASALTGREAVNLIEDLTSKMNRSPQKRLEQIVEFDEKQAAAILRQWMRTEA